MYEFVCKGTVFLRQPLVHFIIWLAKLKMATSGPNKESNEQKPSDWRANTQLSSQDGEPK